MVAESEEFKNKDDAILNQMRTEVQKIIDNHLKGSDKRFSVMDYNQEQVTTALKLLTGNITEDEVMKEIDENNNQMNRIMEQILCESDYINQLKNLARDTRFELNNLQTDLQLQKDLNIDSV